ncbi:Glucans biosynthesis glucosyltransferase H [Roseibacterium elongatum DSM 19469]|uniref:Glucans biosynthesis glucosyltransferase H n=1 Tax=Roseicyclus elongatus DSM 19469 TaxID=1294273 RepID=W8RPP8_9RHOB|nr:glucans biosynthesis glucosyltransferase MdoH [Roseibacterium elongatum]AHM02993.1 Glucans biosynthesis glucosyltransferase H [Roseibacterium elongatum DSM 19469]
MSLAEPHLTVPIARPRWHGPRALAATLAVALTLGIVLAFAFSIAAWTPAALGALPLVALTAMWISGGAATALLGLIRPAEPSPTPPETWRPASRTAILVTICKEEPQPLATHLDALRAGLIRAGLGAATEVFVLSDTQGPDLVEVEEAAFRPLHAAGRLTYRRRPRNTGRKPGNIAEWVGRHGSAFDHMLVLDADSRMTPRRIRHMIAQMERRGDLGLLQAGIALRPGETRFGRHQRVAARLLSRGFGPGFAAWTGDSGNYWGHNAIIRIAAFRAATALPLLPGKAPWGGSILSHDFIEAAWIRRAGWAVALDPATGGSAEEAPQKLHAFHARDRRWCQGNLQHLRLIAEPGLSPISRLHLVMGVVSYLVAPVWLVLVALMAFGGVPLVGLLPLAMVAAVLLLPKLCALAGWWRSARTSRRRRIVLRATIGELATSSVIAPLVMLRQAMAVFAVCLGRDCGWKTGHGPRFSLLPGFAEAMGGWALVGAAVVISGPSALWLAPLALPLCLAPVIVRVLDAPA